MARRACLLRQPELLVQIIEPRLRGNVLAAFNPLLDGILRDLLETETGTETDTESGSEIRR